MLNKKHSAHIILKLTSLQPYCILRFAYVLRNVKTFPQTTAGLLLEVDISLESIYMSNRLDKRDSSL